MRARRTDKGHSKVIEAIKLLGYPCKSLHTQGGGVEDLLVGVPAATYRVKGNPLTFHEPASWLLIEVKTCLNKKGTVQPSQFTDAQREWYAQTEGFPRLVVTGPQDAIDQLRKMTERT